MRKIVDFPEFKVTESDNELSQFARALALPVRIAILKVLITEGCWVSHDVFAQMPFSPVVVDGHLKGLTQIGIVKTKVYNRHRYYSINEDIFRKMTERFTDLFDYYKQAALNPKLSSL